MSSESNATVNGSAQSANDDASDRARWNRERRALIELVRGQRRILNGHRDANATEREAGMMQIASANRRLKELGIEVP